MLLVRDRDIYGSNPGVVNYFFAPLKKVLSTLQPLESLHIILILIVALAQRRRSMDHRKFSELPLTAIEFIGVDTMDFLKNFEVLMYLFIFVDLLESNCRKKQ